MRPDTPMVVYGLYDTGDPCNIRYIGKARGRDAKDRLSVHLAHARAGHGTYRCNWIRSVLADGRTVGAVVLRSCVGNTMACELEREYIARFRALGYRLTNLTDGGDGNPGFALSHESRAKLSLSVHAMWQKRYASVSVGSRFQWGPMPQEVKHKIRIANTGKKRTPEMRAKYRERMKREWDARQGAARKHTAEHTARIAAALVGKHPNLATRQKMRASRFAYMNRMKLVEASHVATV